MSSFDIGLSGIDAARRSLEVIANNIANASSEGYHRQEVNLSPAYSTHIGSVLFGGGVDIRSVTRQIDNILEEEIYRQQSLLSYVSQEYTTLRTVENAFGELSGDDSGINASLDRFFNSLHDLTLSPENSVSQQQVISEAEVLASQFRTLGEFLTNMETQIKLEVENNIDTVNLLTNQIAELNKNISRIEIGGDQANNLRDQRDLLISDLSELMNVRVLSREFGITGVDVGGIPVVVNATSINLMSSLGSDNKLNISTAGGAGYTTALEGGKIGGLLALYNTSLADIRSDLDSLASALADKVNQYHVQGVGSAGSFSSLSGWANTSEDWSDFGTAVTAGSIFMRITNTSTGAITRNELVIDSANGSISDLATDITALTGVSAAMNASTNKLSITADANYTFDFVPAVLPLPTENNLTGTPPTVAVSGIYSGADNDTFTFTVTSGGLVGSDSGVTLSVTDSASNVVATLNVGLGFSAGPDEYIDVADGIKISLTTGILTAGVGETFKVDVFADTDTSNVLSAIGINTFFSGSTASDIAVCSDISNTPSRIATGLGGGLTDNTNAERMKDVRDETVSSLGSLTIGGFYRKSVADVGQQLLSKEMREANIETMMQNLVNQRNERSGVDINDEAAKLLVFEQMYQAMARYLNTVKSAMSSLMDLI